MNSGASPDMSSGRASSITSSAGNQRLIDFIKCYETTRHSCKQGNILIDLKAKLLAYAEDKWPHKYLHLSPWDQIHSFPMNCGFTLLRQ